MQLKLWRVTPVVPELPDITAYVEALRRFAVGKPVERVRLPSFFLVRTFDPPLSSMQGKRLLDVRRLGKQIVFVFEDDLFAVLHLMIAGRLHWKKPSAPVGGRNTLLALDFPDGTLTLTEAGTKKRASLHVVRGEAALRPFDRGGVEPLECDRTTFASALLRENRTLKRALTDPRTISGVGNAYSDEILHRARLSPLQWTSRLDEGEVARLFEATRAVLQEWTDRLRAEVGDAFPEKVTAFRPGMAVHGRYGEPCPVCGSPVQRIVRAENEVNYCATCQTGGHVLADRSLSRLLKEDWPRTIEEWEALPGRGR